MTRFVHATWLLLTLGGCSFVGESWYTENVRDVDGDGAIAERFGGTDCADDNPEITVCDADNDGELSKEAGGTDCDDNDATVAAGAVEVCNGIDDDCDGNIDDADVDIEQAERPTWYRDADGDGFGSDDDTIVACASPDPTEWLALSGDCDDSRGDISPNAPEFCDGIDHNCDGDPTDNAIDQSIYYVDSDMDGYGADVESGVAGCPGSAPAGLSFTNTDCDDNNADVSPVAVEVPYNNIDEDCDGDEGWDQDGDGYEAEPRGPDCDDTNSGIQPDATERCDDGVDNNCNGLADDNDDTIDPNSQNPWFLDADGDGDGSNVIFRTCGDTAPVGYVLTNTDCDDARGTVYLGATEQCDGFDNDCNGLVDDAAIGQVEFYEDADGDGYGGPNTLLGCQLLPGYVDNDDDCDDTDFTINPGAYEVCGDGVDNSCVPGADSDCDGDGFVSEDAGGDDCDDGRAGINPGAQEICDGLDNDCDDLFDDLDDSVDLSTTPSYFLDSDGDGFGSGVVVQSGECAPQSPNLAPNDDDCDDLRDDVYPDAPERCDGVDNSCSGSADDGQVVDPTVFYLDADSDGFGDPSTLNAQGCVEPTDGNDWVENPDDCDDLRSAVSPDAQEICDGRDNDCDTLVDDADGSLDASPWYLDGDGDGYGLGSVVVYQCAQPQGYVSGAGDCDDSEPTTSPGAPEICDGGRDNDCDGLADDVDPDLAGGITWYADADADGFGDPDTTDLQCQQPVGFVSNDLDCDDTATAISPAALEICDGTDNDCDNLVDDDDTAIANAPSWYADNDSDGWGDENDRVAACVAPSGYKTQLGDCDDTEQSVFPGADETCDGLDNDCDGSVDDDDPSLIANVWYDDADSDGYGDPLTEVQGCAQGGNQVPNGLDCDDTNGAINPDATEICDASLGTDIDNDCDGFLGTDDPTFDDPNNLTEFALDADGDGAGSSSARYEDCVTADPIPGFVEGTDVDCNDLDPSQYPGKEWYPDDDFDGYGPDNGVFVQCETPSGSFADQGGDCDDANPSVSPGLEEVCDGIDNDCDSLIDDNDTITNPPQWAPDGDGDGFGVDSGVVSGCVQPPDTVPFTVGAEDCDDGAAGVYPGAQEVCDNGADDDCDGSDNSTAGGGFMVGATLYFVDDDGDGYGVNSTQQYDCADTPPVGLTNAGGDCDDANADVSPMMTVAAGEDLTDAVESACLGSQIDVDAGVFDLTAVLTQSVDVTVQGAGDTTQITSAGTCIRANAGGQIELRDLYMSCDDGFVLGTATVQAVGVEFGDSGLGTGTAFQGQSFTLQSSEIRGSQFQTLMQANGQLNITNVDIYANTFERLFEVDVLNQAQGINAWDNTVTGNSYWFDLANPSQFIFLGSLDLDGWGGFRLTGGDLSFEGGAASFRGLGGPVVAGADSAYLYGLTAIFDGSSTSTLATGEFPSGLSVYSSIIVNAERGIDYQGVESVNVSNTWFAYNTTDIGGTGNISSSYSDAPTGDLQAANPPLFTRWDPNLPLDQWDINLVPFSYMDAGEQAFHPNPLGILGEYPFAYNSDSDGDGMPDAWEDNHGGDLTAGSDDDGDGLTNLEEWEGHTNPGVADTDGDGTDDGLDGSPLDATAS